MIGTYVRRPRLSWWLPEGAREQVAYELELDDGRTTRIDSADHVLVPWPFDALRSRESVTWRVRVWTDQGASEWSEPASIEAGLLDAADWQATWIEPDEVDRRPPGQRPVWLLRHELHARRRRDRRPACTPPRTGSTRPS